MIKKLIFALLGVVAICVSGAMSQITTYDGYSIVMGVVGGGLIGVALLVE